MTCANPYDLFVGRILKNISYGTKITGRGDDIVLDFDRLALGKKLVLWDYFLVPFHCEAKSLRRFDDWRESHSKWRSSFISQRLKSADVERHLCLTFTNNVALIANKKFVSIYDEKNQCIFSAIENESKKSKQVSEPRSQTQT